MSMEAEEAVYRARAEFAFKKAQSEIAKAKAEKATTLVLFDSELDRIPAEISTLTSLTDLQLMYTQVSDLSPISTLSSLTRLTVVGAHVEDIGPIEKLTNLVYLDLHQTHPKDLKSLSNLTKLEVIDLAYTAVHDVAALSKLTRLRQINMKTNGVLDFRPFRNIIIPETASERPNDFWGFSQCRNEYISDFDPQFSNMLDRGLAGFRDAIAYLNGLDDADYDRRLAEWGAAQPGVTVTEERPADADLSARIEAALRGPILKDAIADLHPSNGAFTAGPVNGRAARPIDRPYEELVDTLAFAARRLSDAEAQNRLSRAVVGCFADYLDQVGLPDLNPRLLQFLAASIGGALKDEHVLAALDGMDIARMQTFLAEHDNLIRSYYPDVLIPLSYTSDTDPGKLVKELPALVAAVTADIAKGTEAGLFLPPVSDVQEALVRAEEGVRRGYLTATPEGQAEAGKALQKLAVAEAGFIGRVALRLRQYGTESIAWAKQNPVAAARNADFLIRLSGHAKKLWDLVAPHLPWPL